MSVQQLADRLHPLLARGDIALVLGGNCTIAPGRLALHVTTSQALAADPAAAALTALSQLPAGPLALHLDVNVLDFIDAPLAENTDCRNTGPTLDQVTGATHSHNSLIIKAATGNWLAQRFPDLCPTGADDGPAGLDDRP